MNLRIKKDQVSVRLAMTEKKCDNEGSSNNGNRSDGSRKDCDDCNIDDNVNNDINDNNTKREKG